MTTCRRSFHANPLDVLGVREALMEALAQKIVDIYHRECVTVAVRATAVRPAGRIGVSYLA